MDFYLPCVYLHTRWFRSWLNLWLCPLQYGQHWVPHSPFVDFLSLGSKPWIEKWQRYIYMLTWHPVMLAIFCYGFWSKLCLWFLFFFFSGGNFLLRILIRFLLLTLKFAWLVIDVHHCVTDLNIGVILTWNWMVWSMPFLFCSFGARFYWQLNRRESCQWV